MSRRRAAQVAEQLNKAELEADAGDDQDDEEDGNFAATEGRPTDPAPKRRKVGAHRLQSGGLVLSGSDDEDSGVTAVSTGGGARSAKTRAKAGGQAVLSALEKLREEKRAKDKQQATNELFASLNSGARAATTSPPAPPTVPAVGLRYRCEIMAQVRASSSMDSDKVCPLRPGECIDVLETTQLPTGVTRVRCAKGWVSEKTGSGKTILTYAPAATGTSMFPTSTRPAPAAKVDYAAMAAAASKKAAAAAGAGGAVPVGSRSATAAPARTNKLGSILAGLKKTQVSTVAKSRGEWQSHIKSEGIEAELKQKAKNGYIDKQEFLTRVDWRQHEKEVQNKKELGWKGIN